MGCEVTYSGARGAGVARAKPRVDSSYHVISTSGRWSVTRSGARRAARVFASRPEAVVFAVRIAGPAVEEVVVHMKDGSVAERISPKARPVSR